MCSKTVKEAALTVAEIAALGIGVGLFLGTVILKKPFRLLLDLKNSRQKLDLFFLTH